MLRLLSRPSGYVLGYHMDVHMVSHMVSKRHIAGTVLASTTVVMTLFHPRVAVESHRKCNIAPIVTCTKKEQFSFRVGNLFSPSTLWQSAQGLSQFTSKYAERLLRSLNCELLHIVTTTTSLVCIQSCLDWSCFISFHIINTTNQIFGIIVPSLPASVLWFWMRIVDWLVRV